ncbi:MAG: DUF4239 domain-containing protein [Thermomicrobiales bacterium]
MIEVGIVVAVVVLLSALGLILVRRFVPLSSLAQHTDVAGYVYAVIGVLYAVMLAQMVITSWEEFRDASASATDEASAVLNLSRLADGFPEDGRIMVQTALQEYARHVIEVEWVELGRGEFVPNLHMSPMRELWAAVNRAGQATAANEQVYAASLSQLDQLDDARRKRILLSDEGLPEIMVSVLLIGAVVTVGFSYLFAVDNLWAHGLMTSSLAVLIALLLLLATELETPFSGLSSVSPTAMQFALAEIEASLATAETTS